MNTEAVERRGNQRILTNVAGRPRFWLAWYGGRMALADLSVEGFAMSVSTPPSSDRPFEFLLEREGSAGGASGLAQVVNFVSTVEGGQAGCRFVEIGEDTRARIAEWLADYVRRNSAIALSVDEATSIVLGPSIV